MGSELLSVCRRLRVGAELEIDREDGNGRKNVMKRKCKRFGKRGTVSPNDRKIMHLFHN